MRRNLRALLAGCLVIPLALFAVFAVQGYQQTLRTGEERVRRNAELMEEHVARVLETHAVIIRSVRERIRDLDHEAIRESRELNQFLREQLIDPAVVFALGITDAEGEVIASNRALPAPGNNLGGRNFFRVAQDSDALVLGQQVRGHISEARIFNVAQRRLSRDGGFAGIIFVSVAVDYLEKVAATLAGEDAQVVSVSLVRADGSQLVRFPAMGEPAVLGSVTPLMRNIHVAEAGMHRAVAQGDGLEWIYAYRKVRNFPLYVSYGLSIDAILKPWYRTMAVDFVLVVTAATLLCSMSLLVAAHLRRGALMEKHLERLVQERTAEAERRAAEAEQATRDKEQALRAAEMANYAKAHFLAAASHDLRQPLQALRLFLDLLVNRLKDPMDQQIAQQAALALEGGEHLLSALLDVSTLEAGTIKVTLCDVPLRPLMAAMAEEFADQAHGRGLSLRLVARDVVVRSDPVLLKRMLRNLLANAVRYTVQGGILLGCRRMGGHVRVEVWDTGRGIPADKLEAVFEDFIQLDNSARDRRQGLGLGLSVVRRMARLLGHAVTVRSVIGCGSVFAIELPLAGGAAALMPAEESQAGEGPRPVFEGL